MFIATKYQKFVDSIFYLPFRYLDTPTHSYQRMASIFLKNVTLGLAAYSLSRRLNVVPPSPLDSFSKLHTSCLFAVSILGTLNLGMKVISIFNPSPLDVILQRPSKGLTEVSGFDTKAVDWFSHLKIELQSQLKKENINTKENLVHYIVAKIKDNPQNVDVSNSKGKKVVVRRTQLIISADPILQAIHNRNSKCFDEKNETELDVVLNNLAGQNQIKGWTKHLTHDVYFIYW